MAAFNKISEIVEQAVAGEMERHIPNLRQDIVQRVLEQLQPALATPPGPSPTEILNTALLGLQRANSQGELLSVLLEGCGQFSARAALFVLRGQSAVGWHACGFRDNDGLKNFAINATAGLSAKAIETHLAVTGSCANFEERLAAEQGAPGNDTVIVLPLAVRDKVAGLIYADGGPEPEGPLDHAALDVLVRTAGLWLEVLALRKATGPVGAARPTADAAITAAPAPVASPAAFAAAAAAPAPLPVAPGESTAEVSAAPGEEIAPAISSEDQELHNKAKRFAKLLVEEIKLYNQVKVSEGRQSKDIYDRLKEDIDKSRAAYQKRYAETPAASVDHFSEALVRILADGDISLMGGSFPG
jgi:hypothetical protein